MSRPMNMNSFEGKRILALIREGDYAHAGEEEAIERSFRPISKNEDSWLLDVGCGRGGSADYLRRNGWGHVEGIDRDSESIEYARGTYPEIGFHVCDVLDVPRTVARAFDVIYMLNAFYAFDRQREALAELRKVAKPGAQLVIFDYTVGAKAGDTPNPMMPHAIRLSEIAAMLREAEWEPGSIEDLSSDYARWYAAFVDRIRLKQAEIEKIGGADSYSFVLSMYSGLHSSIVQGELGGAIVHARAT
ncbi:class I SAM-dependent methyltransferase [Candidatus Binatus sp.]|uniref:class I SAM-dependent methyltransferase n=2 Tax=Candidatus Binatus sp. TaxID=2811406 RepID=UPI003CC5B827